MAADSHQVAAQESIPPVRAIHRALSLLQALPGDGPKSAADLARESTMSLSTVIRLLRTLEEAGWAQRGEDRRYEVGKSAVSFGQRLHTFGWMIAVSEALVGRARDRTNETCALHVLDGAERLCVSAAQSPNPVRHVIRVGSHAPVWLGASGKVLLAIENSDDLWRALPVAGGDFYELQGGRRRSIADLRKDCRRVIRTGVAVSSQEWAEDSVGIAVPVYLGQCFIGSLGAAIPITRATASWQQEVGEALREETRVLKEIGTGVQAPAGTIQQLLAYATSGDES